MKKKLCFFIMLFSVFIISANVSAEDNVNAYTIGDYCNYEMRGYVSYRTVSLDTSYDTISDMLANSYYIVKTVNDDPATGKLLVIGYEGELLSSMIKENENEWTNNAYYGSSAKKPAKYSYEYIAPEDFSNIDYNSFDYEQYDMIIIEMSAKDSQISKDMFTWLTRLTQKSQYILIDRDIQDEYFYYENTDEIKCTYDPAEKKLTLFPGTFSAKTYEEAVDCYTKNFGVKNMKSLFSNEKYELDFSEVEIVRLPNKFYLSKYIMTPFTNLKEIEIGNEKGCTNVYEHACEGLKSLEIIPLENVELIGAFAFANSGITQIKSGKLTEIGNNAFENCKDLTTVTTGKELVSIGANAFKDSGINSFTIPETVTVIPKKAFYNCSMLEDVEIALTDDGMKIGKDAFTGVSDTCNIKWDFGEGDNIYYNLLPFNMPSYEVDINVLQDYNNKEYTITKGERVKKEYTITFDANGGECDVESMIVEEGGVYENLPVPTREGFEFVGWIDVDGNVYKDGEKVGVERDTIVLADWKNSDKNENQDTHEHRNEIEQIEDTNWDFHYDDDNVKKNAYEMKRLISNETLSMRPIYRMNKCTKGYIYSGYKQEQLSGRSFGIDDEKNADKLLEIITRKGNNNKILLLTSKETYNNCKKHKNSKGKVVINSGLSVNEFKRALTIMHCKYFQYLLYIQNPYTDTIYDLDRYDKSKLSYKFTVTDWENDISIPNNADVYPVDTAKFNEYYSYCQGMSITLNELIRNRFSFDTNTTVVDALLAINEYIMDETGFDQNPLNESYVSNRIKYKNGKKYIETDIGVWTQVTIDEDGFLRDANNKKLENYVDNYGRRIDSHRIYDLKWFLTDTPDGRNYSKSGEKKHGVCASYSKFICAIMGKCGYEVLIVGGHNDDDELVHSFNRMVLDGRPYYCDFTDTANSNDDPCRCLFLEKKDMEDKENHRKIEYNKDENGYKVTISNGNIHYNLTLDAGNGRMIVGKTGYKLRTSYYEMSVDKNTKLSTVLANIDSGRFKYAFLGWYTGENGGKKLKPDALITQNMKIYAHWRKIKIKKVKIKSISTNNKGLEIKYKKLNTMDKYTYIVQICNNKKFGKNNVKQYSSESPKGMAGIKLKKKGTYYVRVMASTKDSCGNNLYGNWSTVKKVKVE